jgi:hypothetical protein
LSKEAVVGHGCGEKTKMRMCDFQHAVWFGIVISGEHIGIMDESISFQFLHQNGKYTELRGGLTGVQKRGLWKTSLMSTKLKRIFK